MYARQLLNSAGPACTGSLLGCATHRAFVVLARHIPLGDEYIAGAEGRRAAIRPANRSGRPRADIG